MQVDTTNGLDTRVSRQRVHPRYRAYPGDHVARGITLPLLNLLPLPHGMAQRRKNVHVSMYVDHSISISISPFSRKASEGAIPSEWLCAFLYRSIISQYPHDLLEVGEGGRKALQHRAYPTKCRALQLLAPVHRIRILEQPNIVFRHTAWRGENT